MMINRYAFFCFLLALFGLPFESQGEPVEAALQGAIQEIWEDQEGNKVEDMTQSKAYREGKPTRTTLVDKLESGPRGENYGVRYSAFLRVPANGNYTFLVAANDTAELWLSSDSDPSNLQQIVDCNGYWYTAKSKPIPLEKGKDYYIRVLHKQATGNDHMVVSWQKDGMSIKVIDKAYLIPALDDKNKQALDETAKLDGYLKELRRKLSRQNQQTMAAWLENLSDSDSKLLEKVIQEDEKSLKGKSPAECRKVFKFYATLARGIVPTTKNPVNNRGGKRLLYMEEKYLESLTPDELKTYGPHRLSRMLGAIPKGIQPVNRTVKLNSKGNKLYRDMETVSTGVYALPGVPVTITLPNNELAQAGLKLRIGHHTNADSNQNCPLVSMPRTTREFPLNGVKTTVTSPHGGLVFIQVPKKIALEQTPVIFESVIDAPRFVLGRTSNEAWKKIREAPAPWGELISEHLILLVHSDALRKLDDPVALMTWSNENCRRHEDFYAYYPGYPFRMHACLYPREGAAYWPLEWQPKNMELLLDLERQKFRNDGLFLHEHGHHADFDEMIVGYWSESTCNWAGYYMKSLEHFNWKDSPDIHMRKLFDPADKEHEEIRQEGWYSISTMGTHHWSYKVTSMMLGYIVDFGWEPFKKTIHRMRDQQDPMYQWDFVQGDMKDRAVRDQAKIDRYLIGLSEGAQRDVRPYFEHFKLRPSSGAAAYLDQKQFPKWDLSYLPVSGELTATAAPPLKLPNPEQTVLSMAGPTKIIWEPQSTAGGSVKVTPEGDVIYTPKQGFSGVDNIRYVLENSIGKSPVKQLAVKVGMPEEGK